MTVPQPLRLCKCFQFILSLPFGAWRLNHSLALGFALKLALGLSRARLALAVPLALALSLGHLRQILAISGVALTTKSQPSQRLSFQLRLTRMFLLLLLSLLALTCSITPFCGDLTNHRLSMNARSHASKLCAQLRAR